MPSFDVVSEMDMHEVRNAVDQAARELGTRFDFRGVDAKIELEEESMISFSNVLEDGEADAIRSYIISRANLEE